MKIRMEHIVFIVILISAITANELTKYLSNEELYDYLRDVNDNYQNISHLYSIGTTTLGEELWVLMLTLAPSHESTVPNVKIVGNIHGNEPVGRELILHLIRVLLYGYVINDEEVIHLLRTTKIHFLPSANPDGFSKAVEGECNIGPGRKNANNVDLNRDFLPIFSMDDKEFHRQREIETTAIVQWMSEIHFVLSVSIHSGSLVVVYPYDEATPGDNTNGESLTDDNDIFKHLAQTYASGTKGAIYESCPESRTFENGVINGASWYSARGTMMDYNYYYHGCMELTVEVSCCKYPHPVKLMDIIDNHIPALVSVIREAHQGIKGVITCEGDRGISYIQVLGRNLTIQSTPEGEYWRILLPGRYFLQVESGSCTTEVLSVEIPRRKHDEYPSPIIMNINLRKPYEMINDDETELETMDNNDEDELNVTVKDTSYQISESAESGAHFNNTRETFSPRAESSLSSAALQYHYYSAAIPILLCSILIIRI
ncbi:hypothetical protein O3M35_001365 [Rhynocoris fuscipes]|uniref:Peptidase M14 domain-containing protein n=1 Tax=Rhynocoris fuscipes TaxID=488301 RepID=A0AAW1DSN8_9HEMI